MGYGVEVGDLVFINEHGKAQRCDPVTPQAPFGVVVSVGNYGVCVVETRLGAHPGSVVRKGFLIHFEEPQRVHRGRARSSAAKEVFG